MADRLHGIRKWWIKWTHWEFWPFSLLYFPVGFYFAWLAIKRGSFFFFTSANPSIEFGGMLGEKKSEIYQILPNEYIPKTKLFVSGEAQEAIQFAAVLGYPIIAKPNIGERGIWVEKFEDQKGLEKYLETCPVPFLIQEIVNYPIELGVFYIRYPDQQKGKITSIVQKEFLTVTGDGKSNVRQLLMTNTRANLQVDMNHDRISDLIHKVPGPGERVEVESIGNHCRGTKFVDGALHITPALESAFDKLSSRIPGFYFGRFDLKCTSLTDLENLRDFKILELNGAGAEPGHIYQPGYPLLKAYKDIFWHLSALAEISCQNKLNGHPYWSFRKGMKKLGEIRRYNSRLNSS